MNQGEAWERARQYAGQTAGLAGILKRLVIKRSRKVMNLNIEPNKSHEACCNH